MQDRSVTGSMEEQFGGGVQLKADPREHHSELVMVILIIIKPAPLLAFLMYY